MSAPCPPVARRYLSAGEAGVYIGKTTEALAQHRRRGTGPRWTKVDGRIVYDIRDLDDYYQGA